MTDVSYGMYVYAFPLQQMIVVAGLAWLGYWGVSLLAVALTASVAWLSWQMIERPAIDMGRRPRRERTRAGETIGSRP